jgi:hypothetical protein
LVISTGVDVNDAPAQDAAVIGLMAGAGFTSTVAVLVRVIIQVVVYVFASATVSKETVCVPAVVVATVVVAVVETAERE